MSWCVARKAVNFNASKNPILFEYKNSSQFFTFAKNKIT